MIGHDCYIYMSKEVKSKRLPPLEPIESKHELKQEVKQEVKPQKMVKTRDEIDLKFKAIKYDKTQSIKIVSKNGKKTAIETDSMFVKSIADIAKSREGLLQEIIGLKTNLLTEMECEEIHFKGKLHSQANIVNRNSHKTLQQVKNNASLKSLYCRCGCQRMKGPSFPACYDLQQINILGSGILLFFLFLKTLVFNLLIFVCIYAVFSIATNLMGDLHLTKNPSAATCISEYCSYRDRVSIYNKKDYNFMSMIQGWIGLGGLIIWGIFIRFVKYYGRQKNKSIDRNLTSASDYAIKIDNLPYGDYNQEELVEYLEKLWEKIDRIEKQKKEMGVNQEQIDHSDLESEESRQSEFEEETHNLDKANRERHLDLKSIQIIYNMEFSRNMYEKMEKLCLQIHKIIEKNRIEDKIIIENKQEYLKIKKDLVENYELYQDLRKKFLTDGNFRKKISTRSAIVEFKSKRGKDAILREFGKEKITLLKELKEKIKGHCFGENNELIFKGSIPSIARAPEPSDIIWQNCEKKYSALRIFGIYIVTFLIILISFGIIIGLEYVQVYFASSDTNSTSLSTIINIITSLVLQIVNKILWFSLFYLLNFEYNHTNTNKIISQMNKTSVLMWINIIFLPIVVNYIFSNRYYGATGVAGIVFDYHVSAVTINILLKLVDPLAFIIKIGLEIRCIRNYLIKARYHKTEPDQQENQTLMKKIYSLYEGPQFDIAQSYVFIVSNVLHAFFFCELQPFILVLVLIQAFFFYWVCKIKILKVCNIPHLTELLVFEVASYQLMLAPVFYGVGSIFNSYVSSRIDPQRQFQYIPAAICAGLGLFNYFNPKNIVHVITEKIAKSFACFNPEKKRISRRDSINNQSKKKEKRKEEYFKGSNSLSLLGFEKKLMGEVNFLDIELELRNYCYGQVKNILTDQFMIKLKSKYEVDPRKEVDNSENQKIGDTTHEYFF